MAETTIAATPSGKAATRLATPINWGKVFTYAILLFGVILMIFPFLWMVSASLMSLTEVTFGKLIPSQPLFSNYAEAFQRANFGQRLVHGFERR